MNIRAIATLHRRGMNRTEEKYAQHLRDRMMVGEIKWWAFEPWKLRLSDDTFYTPDFIVVSNDLALEAHEVKSFWMNQNRSGWTDDARVKIKVAAEQHPVRFVAATLMKDQSWEFEYFQKDREESVKPLFVKLVEAEDKFHSMTFDTKADSERALGLVRFVFGLEGSQ